MKKYYVISLIVTFVTAVVCLGVSGVAIYGWSKDDQKKAGKFFVEKTAVVKSIACIGDRKEVSRSAGLKPYTLSAAEISEVDLRVNLGKVVIVGTEAGEIKLVPTELEADCEMVVSQKKDSLKVEILKTDSKSSGCQGGVVAEIPLKTKIEVENAKGDVSISKMIGEVKVRMGAGMATVLDSMKEVDIKIGAGDIELRGQSSEVKVQVGAGRIMAKLTQKISDGEWSLENGAGDIEVEIPVEQTAEESLKVGMGKVTGTNLGKEDSNFKIKARSGIGNIEVVKK
ncbi:hypothetical protein [Bdellovibrio sp. HCB274]|uniref:hypothetical protein n=1 Tax=Bdellovibrio sp. HCB274 TaxID=3394361 RepID=UPI0039B65570